MVTRTQKTRDLEPFKVQFFQWYFVEKCSIKEVKRRFDLLFLALAKLWGKNYQAEKKDWKTRLRTWRRHWPGVQQRDAQKPYPADLDRNNLFYEGTVPVLPYLPSGPNMDRWPNDNTILPKDSFDAAQEGRHDYGHVRTNIRGSRSRDAIDTEDTSQIDDPQAGYAPELEQLLSMAIDLPGMADEEDILNQSLPHVQDTIVSQDLSQVWSSGFGPNQELSWQESSWGTFCGSSGMQTSSNSTPYTNPYLSEGSQPPPLGLRQFCVDSGNHLDIDNPLDTLTGDLESNCVLVTNTRKRPPRPSFTAPPSQMRNHPPYGFMKEGENPIPYLYPKSVDTNRGSVSHNLPTKSEQLFEPASTANHRVHPLKVVCQPSSTQNDHKVWDENGNGSDPTSDEMITADYTQRYRD